MILVVTWPAAPAPFRLLQLNWIHGGCLASVCLWYYRKSYAVMDSAELVRLDSVTTIFGPVFNIYIPEINLNIYLHMYLIDLVLNIFWIYSTYNQDIKIEVLFKNFLKNILWRILKNRFWIYSTIYRIEKQRTCI